MWVSRGTKIIQRHQQGARAGAIVSQQEAPVVAAVIIDTVENVGEAWRGGYIHAIETLLTDLYNPPLLR